MEIKFGDSYTYTIEGKSRTFDLDSTIVNFDTSSSLNAFSQMMAAFRAGHQPSSDLLNRAGAELYITQQSGVEAPYLTDTPTSNSDFQDLVKTVATAAESGNSTAQDFIDSMASRTSVSSDNSNVMQDAYAILNTDASTLPTDLINAANIVIRDLQTGTYATDDINTFYNAFISFVQPSFSSAVEVGGPGTTQLSDISDALYSAAQNLVTVCTTSTPPVQDILTAKSLFDTLFAPFLITSPNDVPNQAPANNQNTTYSLNQGHQNTPYSLNQGYQNNSPNPIPKKSNMTLDIGVVGGVLVLAGILFFALKKK